MGGRTHTRQLKDLKAFGDKVERGKRKVNVSPVRATPPFQFRTPRPLFLKIENASDTHSMKNLKCRSHEIEIENKNLVLEKSVTPRPTDRVTDGRSGGDIPPPYLNKEHLSNYFYINYFYIFHN